MPYITPFSTPPARVRRCLFIPDEPLWLAAVNGALTELTKRWNWEDIDGISVDDAVAVAQDMIDEYFSGECMSEIGIIAAFGRDTSPGDNWLLMDGSTYDSDDYPEFAAVAPSAWLFESGAVFTLPDMTDRTTIGAGGVQTDVGLTGGEVNHDLTTSEIPAHNHGAGVGTAFLTFVGAGGGGNVIAGTQFTTASNTANTGGGDPHNNMPPYLSVRYYIRVK